MTNILQALNNLTENPITDIYGHYPESGKNRANSMGAALEAYVKDLFCNTFNESKSKKEKVYGKEFSYIGNQNNPPDLMIANGDAIEVKKIESLTTQIALNSSYPKDKLYANSPMITKACRESEDWEEKDLIYIVGVIGKDQLKALYFIYGDCYAARQDAYERPKRKIAKGVNELPGITFSETKELGRVNKVDPLGITYLRVRGMWGIENPLHVFGDIADIESDNELTVNAIMLKEKYESFPQSDRDAIEGIVSENFTIKDIEIKSPNDPKKVLSAKHIKFIK